MCKILENIPIHTYLNSIRPDIGTRAATIPMQCNLHPGAGTSFPPLSLHFATCSHNCMRSASTTAALDSPRRLVDIFQCFLRRQPSTPVYRVLCHLDNVASLYSTANCKLKEPSKHSKWSSGCRLGAITNLVYYYLDDNCIRANSSFDNSLCLFTLSGEILIPQRVRRLERHILFLIA